MSSIMTSCVASQDNERMNCWRRGILIALFTCTIGFSLISSCSGLRQHKLRSRRAVSEDTRNCKHWKFETTDDPHFADINVKLHNAASAAKKMSVALQCATMNKIQEPKSAFSVSPGRTRNFAFRIAVASDSYHKDSSVRKHKCKLSTWNEDAHSLVTCQIDISVWPNGMFYYKCSRYQKGQLTVSQSTSLRAKQINIYNKGEPSILLINSTCKPVVLTLQWVDMYKQLNKDQKWTLEFPLSCSGATNLNYRGQCSVKIFHVCREVTTPVKKTKFEFMDGEIEECEHVKSMLGKLARNSFAASFGVNDDWSAALAVIAIVELVLIIATLIVKIIFVGLTKGWDSSRKEFCDRFYNTVKITRANSVNKTTNAEPNEPEGPRCQERFLLEDH